MEIARSLLRAAGLALSGRLRFGSEYVGRELIADDGVTFKIFRHMRIRAAASPAPAVLVVRFRFARLSHAGNRRASRIPIPLIAGFPGFRHKLWMIDETTGFWQGLYEWRDRNAVDAYLESFVLGLMNRRAVEGSVSCVVMPETSIGKYLRERLAPAARRYR